MALTAAVVGCCTSAAGSALRETAPLPPLSSFVLAPGDFGAGASGYVDSSQTAADKQQLYIRLFKPGVRIGSKPLATAVSIALVEPDASTAQFAFTDLQISMKTKSGRETIAKEWAAVYVKGLTLGGKKTSKAEKLTVGPATDVSAAGMVLPVSVKASGGTAHMALIVVDVDRVLSIDVLMSELNTTLPPSDSLAVLSAIDKRLKAAFTVANTGAPSISGTAAVGQTLTADAGAWSGAPSSFTYNWSRCDAAGANCQAVAGAAASTYQPSSADVGSTLVATATGTNSVGSASASSPPTAVVTS